MKAREVSTDGVFDYISYIEFLEGRLIELFN